MSTASTSFGLGTKECLAFVAISSDTLLGNLSHQRLTAGFLAWNGQHKVLLVTPVRIRLDISWNLILLPLSFIFRFAGFQWESRTALASWVSTILAHLASSKSGLTFVACSVNAHSDGFLDSEDLAIILDIERLDGDCESFTKFLRTIGLDLRAEDLLWLAFLGFFRCDNNFLLLWRRLGFTIIVSDSSIRASFILPGCSWTLSRKRQSFRSIASLQHGLHSRQILVQSLLLHRRWWPIVCWCAHDCDDWYRSDVWDQRTVRCEAQAYFNSPSGSQCPNIPTVSIFPSRFFFAARCKYFVGFRVGRPGSQFPGLFSCHKVQEEWCWPWNLPNNQNVSLEECCNQSKIVCFWIVGLR